MSFVELVLICITCIYALSYAVYNLRKKIKAAVGTIIIVGAALSLSIYTLFFKY